MRDDIITLINDTDSAVKLPLQIKSPSWKLLVVDDDPEVHSVTKFVLHEQKILGRPLNLIHADSAEQAKSQLKSHSDIAVALLDVVMETDHAGLDLVQYMRDELSLKECRLILRTGQPGYAPELTVIHDYDINDYRTKSELTHTRLITTVSAALRSYEQLHSLAEHRRGLELIIRAASDLLEQHAIADLAEGVLTQLAALLKLSPNGIVVTHRGSPVSDDRERTYVVGASGAHAKHIARPLDTLPDERIVNAIQDCVKKKKHVFGADYTVLYLQTTHRQDAAIFLDTRENLADIDRQLLDVFVTNITACFRNVRLVEKLNHLAFHDQLTGLLNRQGFIAELDAASCGMSGNVTALIDLEHFTDLNDGLGHDFGDALLIAVAKRLSENISRECRIARLGADIFGITGPDELVNEGIIKSIFNESFDVGDYRLPVSISIGICSRTDNADSGLTFLKRASIALNIAKQSPTLQIHYFRPDMEDEIRKRVDIIRELRTAFHEGKLQVWYQPQISIATGEVAGMEALLRWPDGKGFAHPPSVFIPLAEYSGLIFSIGEWALNESCIQYEELEKSGYGNLRIAVNVSMPQFQQAGFVDTVSACLKKYSIPPEFLELEITESIAMDEPGAVKERLNALRDLGIQIAIDDFGTGYSSLSQLQSMPIDYLKIDRAFILEIEEGKSGIFAETILDFCRKLDVLSIAEGVETPEQAAYLKTLGCDIIQGYLYAKPMPSGELMKWLSGRRPGSAAG
jgi:diguanylate cyclase (GGDEF)-like protein